VVSIDFESRECSLTTMRTRDDTFVMESHTNLYMIIVSSKG